MINISYFYNPLESIGNHHRLSTCGFVLLSPCRRAPLYYPMLILACLPGVSGLVVSIGQWLQTEKGLSGVYCVRWVCTFQYFTSLFV